MRPFMATYRAAASQKSRISYVRGSIERFRSGSALSVPTDIRQPSSPPRVPFCAGEKKTSRLPRNPVKEKERERKKKERKREKVQRYYFNCCCRLNGLSYAISHSSSLSSGKTKGGRGLGVEKETCA